MLQWKLQHDARLLARPLGSMVPLASHLGQWPQRGTGLAQLTPLESLHLGQLAPHGSRLEWLF